eukprot:IDg9449t1
MYIYVSKRDFHGTLRIGVTVQSVVHSQHSQHIQSLISGRIEAFNDAVTLQVQVNLQYYCVPITISRPTKSDRGCQLSDPQRHLTSKPLCTSTHQIWRSANRNYSVSKNPLSFRAMISLQCRSFNYQRMAGLGINVEYSTV